jgi:glycosyltransferase involved in cell wall biosynthesis
MRIGFEAKRAFYNQSGLGNYSRSTIEHLTKFFPSHNYFLFTPSVKDHIYTKIPSQAEIITPSALTGGMLKSFWRTFRMSGAIKRKKLDIFHGLSNELPHNAHKTGAKTVVTIHDLIFLRYPELYAAADRAIYLKKFKYAAHIADSVIAISEQTKTDIINFLDIDESKIEVVYQGCNPIFSKEISQKQKIEAAGKYNLPKEYMLYVGTVEKRKNILSAVIALNENNIDLPLIIIGKKTDYQDEVEAYLIKHKMENQVKIFNNIPFADFPAIYQQALLFIYPSVFEGFGIPIIEALNSGVPVITTRGGCFSEAGGFAARYIDPHDTDEIGAAIKEISEDKQIQARMIKDGKEYTEKFSEERISKHMMNVYLKI